MYAKKAVYFKLVKSGQAQAVVNGASKSEPVTSKLKGQYTAIRKKRQSNQDPNSPGSFVEFARAGPEYMDRASPFKYEPVVEILLHVS